MFQEILLKQNQFLHADISLIIEKFNVHMPKSQKKDYIELTEKEIKIARIGGPTANGPVSLGLK